MKATTHLLLGTLLVMSFVFAACETAPVEEDTTVTVEEEVMPEDSAVDTEVVDTEVETEVEVEETTTR